MSHLIGLTPQKKNAIEFKIRSEPADVNTLKIIAHYMHKSPRIIVESFQLSDGM